MKKINQKQYTVIDANYRVYTSKRKTNELQ